MGVWNRSRRTSEVYLCVILRPGVAPVVKSSSHTWRLRSETEHGVQGPLGCVAEVLGVRWAIFLKRGSVQSELELVFPAPDLGQPGLCLSLSLPHACPFTLVSGSLEAETEPRGPC